MKKSNNITFQTWFGELVNDKELRPKAMKAASFLTQVVGARPGESASFLPTVELERCGEPFAPALSREWLDGMLSDDDLMTRDDMFKFLGLLCEEGWIEVQCIIPEAHR